MASSQIEIASSSPFGCALRDRNHREACSRESGNVKSTHHHHHANFQRNMKNFVMDLNTCMVVSSDSTTNKNENNSSSSNNNQRKAPKNSHLERLRITPANPFINNNNINNNETSLASLISPRHSGLLNRWATRQACQMVSNLENEAELLSMDDNDMLPRTSSSSEEEDSSSETQNLGGASSLVQIWEKRLNQSSVSKPNTPRERIGSTSSSINENANAFSSENANALTGEEQCFDGPSGNEESLFPDWESSDHSLSPSGRSERDRVRVADIIKKLTATNPNQSPTPSFADDNEHEGYGSSVTGSPCRERECGNQQQQQQHSEQNQRVNCSLRIRGRRAYNDLLAQMKNDRHGELNNLVERGAVSKFPQRGRIQVKK